MVYLDLSHKDPHELDVKLGGIMEIYEKFMGDDPRKVPMKIFPAVHYSMGGMWIDYNQMTNIPGIFAAGECDYSQHGGNRLGANSLLSAIYGGMVAGPNAVEYANGLEKSAEDLSSSLFETKKQEEQQEFDKIMNMDGTENAYALHNELGEWMTNNMTVVRHNDKLLETDDKLQELLERWENINMHDSSKWNNHAAMFTRQLKGMIHLARVMTLGAYHRNESRGAHYKPEFPERNDEDFLKTTKAQYNPQTNHPEFEYEDVDTSLIKPRKRDYSQAKASSEKGASN